MRRKLTPREVMLLIVLLVLALGSGYYLLFYRPTTEKIDSLESSILTTEDTIDADRVRIAQRDQMKAELEEIFANDPDPSSMAPYDNSRNVMHELYAILEAAQSYSLSFASVNVGEDDDVVRRNVSLNFTCAGYPAAKDILQQLHDSPYRCLLSSLSISLRDRARTEGGWWYDYLLDHVDRVPDPDELDDSFADISVSASLTFFEYVEGDDTILQDLSSAQWETPLDDAYTGPEIPAVEEGYNGWMRNSDGLYFYFRNGAMVTDEWINTGGNHWYYMQVNGVMATGFQYVSNPAGTGFFYFATEGEDVGGMLTGWQQISPDNAGWFEPQHNGHYGSCTYTDAWGDFKDYRPVV